MQYLITPLLEVLNPTNTVSRNRLLSFDIGNSEAEIYNCLIAKHVYYNNLGKLTEGGWFYSTIKDLHLSSGYAEDAQKTAIRHLIKHGLIESELKGLPAKRYFRIIPDADKLASLLRSGEEAQKAIAMKYDKELEKRKKRRYNRKHRLVEVTAFDSVQSVPDDEKSKAVTNLNSVSGADESDSVRVIGNSGDICSETDFCAQNSCSVGYGGTSSPEALRETKDNKNQSYFFQILLSFILRPRKFFRRTELKDRQQKRNYPFLKSLRLWDLTLRTGIISIPEIPRPRKTYFVWTRWIAGRKLCTFPRVCEATKMLL